MNLLLSSAEAPAEIKREGGKKKKIKKKDGGE